MWDAASVALLKKLWAEGQSAAPIATRLGHSRNAVCAKLLRMGLKRGHKPPTAKPKIWPAPGSEDTELRCLMEQEAGHGEATVYAGVQG